MVLPPREAQGSIALKLGRTPPIHDAGLAQLARTPLSAFTAIAIVSACAAAPVEPPPFDPSAYNALRNAYIARDADAAAASYALDALLTSEAETPPLRAEGRGAIAEAYRDVFASLPDGPSLDLNFRIASRERVDAGVRESGAYRLRAGRAGTGFGQFEVVRDPESGLFTLDRSLPGAREDFEAIAGPLLFAAEREELDPFYYGRLTGRYQLPDGCDLIVTHSVVRLLVRNSCDQSWRGLERVTGTSYTFGDAVVPSSVSGHAAFDLPRTGLARSVTFEGQLALRDDPYTKEDVSFVSFDGTVLAGTVWTPRTAPFAATVLVHGSGPQDRNGYASIIAVMADILAASGHVVLAYDKRGAGRSDGDGAHAGFDTLAADAEAGRAFLVRLPAAAGLPAGLSGSSQAGWVIAEAIRAGAAPDHVILVGAAGAALTVEEQNLYNTKALMLCAGLAPSSIDIALAQQRAFFDVLANRAAPDGLATVTAEAARVEGLGDWLFPGPDGIDRTSDDWFNVLDLDTDPRPVWASFIGKLTIIQGRHDDSTPAPAITERWAALNRDRPRPARLVLLDDTQHIGLAVSGPCDTDFARIGGFSPDFIAALEAAAEEAGRKS